MDREKDMKLFFENAGALYDFILTGYENMRREHAYGGVKLNMVEAHTLTALAENPGMRVGDVAAMWKFTRGAATKNVDRLCRQGLVTKTKAEGNKKEVRIYPTEKGLEIARRHMRHDREEIAAIARDILAVYNPEQVENFISVMKDMTRFFSRREL